MKVAQCLKTIVAGNSPTLRLAGDPLIAGKTAREWDTRWAPVEGGFTVLHSDLRHDVGLFRASLRGNIMYIGKAVEEENGGFRKRLSDFRRESPSAREHHGAMRIHEHREELDLHVLITGSVEVAELLKPAMIVLHSPPWNMEQEEARLAHEANVRRQLITAAGATKPRPTLKLVSK